MQPYPRGIADHEVESAALRDIREMRGPREGQGTARAQRAPSRHELARARSFQCEARRVVRRGAHAVAEQVAAAHRGEEVAASRGAALDLLGHVCEREST